jgi:hypothetical protein
MKTLKLSPYLNASIAAALLAGCGGSQPPIGAPGAMPQSATLQSLNAQRSALVAQRNDGESWMAPDAVSQDLLYVSDVRTVTVYSYPQGKLQGTLRHFYIATGMCVDKNDNVFIVDDGYYKIFEYAHGGTKRLATLQSPTKDPVGCSIDPTTGNLAVASLGFGSAATIAIYKNARGKPTTYQDSAIYQMYFCGYDDKGNLFVDGISAPGSGNFALAELPKGTSTFTNIAVSQYIAYPGGVQWDGKHVAVGDQNTPVIYQFAISGSNGTKVGTTPLGSGAQYVKQFWIQSQTVVAPNVTSGSASNVLLFKYPAGGSATKRITKGVIAPQGTVVSLAPNR